MHPRRFKACILIIKKDCANCIYCAKKIYLVLPVGEALLARGGHHALPRELQQRGVEDLVDGGLAGVAHVLLDVRTVHEGQVDGPGDVGRGQNENV